MQKEAFEWMQSWCDHTTKTDLPRVLLIGDSITRGYQEKVRDLLRGKCYVDYISVSYAVDAPFYSALIESFTADSHYDLVHFNHGLHGSHMTAAVYEAGMDALTVKLSKMARVMLVTSTCVYEKGLAALSEQHVKLVTERNEALQRIAEKYGCPIDDLHAVSTEIPKEHRNPDGIHFLADGYITLAQAAADSILKEICA